MMKILVLGSNGMIGSAILRVLSRKEDWDVVGAVRSEKDYGFKKEKLIQVSDLTSLREVYRIFDEVKPNFVINCAGTTKHAFNGDQPITTLSMNALLPHRLVQCCVSCHARLIHVSSDCVFSGKQGNYLETDVTDASDLYGRTKALGEVIGQNVITLRTSTIGHENKTKYGLLEWFLSQQECHGFKKAIFSGLTTVEFAKVIRDVVIPNPTLKGLYHVGAKPISKYDLLVMINKVYQSKIKIYADENFSIDRSLNSEKFAKETGYIAPEWTDLIAQMRLNYKQES